MHQLIRINILCFAVCFLVAVVHAQELDKPPQEKSEMIVARILVVDPDGHPLDGATVRPGGLRSDDRPGALFPWRVDDFGPEPSVVTNAEGIAEIPYPKFVSEKNETDELILAVEHPEFVFLIDNHVNVHKDPAQIQLERGFRIAASAVHGETGKAISTDLFAVNSTRPLEPWKLHDNGMLVSPVFKETESLLRVIQIAENKPALFSELIRIKTDGNSRVMLKDVKLFPGTRVEGRLADTVARPIKNGYVCAEIIHLPESNNPLESWSWKAKTPIAEDGTFVFESLPSNEVLQLIPICDGWVPAKPTEESLAKFFWDEKWNLKGSDSVPQLFELAGGTTSIVLDMIAATSARITVLDPDGSPLANANVFLQPKQKLFQSSFGSPLGYTLDFREALLSGKSAKWDRVAAEARYRTMTNSDGVAIVHNLPVNARVFVDVTHDEYKLPDTDNLRDYSVALKPGQVAEFTTKMQKKGTEMSGDGKGDKQ